MGFFIFFIPTSERTLLFKTVSLSCKTFKSYEKLKSKKLTEAVFKQGDYFFSFPFRIVYWQKEDQFKLPAPVDFKKGFPIKFGVSVSSKNFKRAVDRNRIKRLTREAWRLHKHILYEIAEVQQWQLGIFFIYTQKEIKNFKEIEAGVLKAIDSLKMLNEIEKKLLKK